MTATPVRASAAALALSLTSPALAGFGGIPGPGDAGFATGNPRATDFCTYPATPLRPAVNMCQYFGIEAAFLLRLDVLPAGSFWITQAGWWVNVPGGSAVVPLVYPAWYTPAVPNDPMADLKSKIVSVRVLVDFDTPQEKSFVYTDPLRIAGYSTWGDLVDAFAPPEAKAWPGIHFLPTLMPLSIGQHRMKLFWTLSDFHCDGIGTDALESCLPKGEFCIRGCGNRFWFWFAPVSTF